MRTPVPHVDGGSTGPTDQTPVLPHRDALLAGLRLSTVGVVVTVEHPDGSVITWANPAGEHLLGSRPGALSGIELRDIALRPLDPDRLPEDVTDLAATLDAVPGSAEVSLRGLDGTTRLARVRGARVDDAQLASWVVVIEPLDQQVRADARLRASEERFRTLAAHAPIGILVSEVGLRLGFVNDRARHLWDQPAEVMASPRWLDPVHPADRERLVTALAGVLAGGEADVPLRIETRGGGERMLRLRAAPVALDGKGAGFVASVQDMTLQAAHEAELRHAALHDPLTGLPNRAHLDAALDALASDRRDRVATAALMFFDLDDFKQINDQLGHAAGDAVLVEVGQRLSGALRDDDVLARLGGDEFVILCRGVPDVEVARALGERMRNRLDPPFTADGRTLHIRASVGVAMVRPGDDRSQQVLRDADAAMYEAKRRGRGRVMVFDEEAHRAAARRRDLLAEDDLRAALADRRLEISWQPIIGEADDAVGVEALVRWTHPERGAIPAEDLLLLAEEHDLMASLGQQVLRASCAQFQAWRTADPGGAPAQLFVNVGLSELRPSLAEDTAEALALVGVEPTRLVLEVPEAALHDKDARSALVAVRALGVQVAVDRFDRGAASVRTLVDPLLCVLKVRVGAAPADGDPGGSDADGAAMAAAIALATDRGVVVVAQGVETPAHLAAARAAGCTRFQGYLVGRPMPAGDLAAAHLRGSRAD